MDVFLIFILMLVIPIIASINIRSTYNKYKQVNNESGLTGFDVAKEMLEKNGLDSIYIVENPGNLSDCYDSSRRVVKLSKEVFHGSSLAALSIAAHECGHAIQDKEGYYWMRIRSLIFPIVNFGTQIAYILMVVGWFLGALDLIYLAIALTALGLLFQLVTLPVEFDASKRAKEYLIKEGKISSKEEAGVAKVLNSAAMTYVAGVLSAALEIVYLLMQVRGRD